MLLATASLYVVLRTELNRSTELFLADKLHVVRTILREQPGDEDALREEIELESAARRYQHFYIRLLDPQGRARPHEAGPRSWSASVLGSGGGGPGRGGLPSVAWGRGV